MKLYKSWYVFPRPVLVSLTLRMSIWYQLYMTSYSRHLLQAWSYLAYVLLAREDSRRSYSLVRNLSIIPWTPLTESIGIWTRTSWRATHSWCKITMPETKFAYSGFLGERTQLVHSAACYSRYMQTHSYTGKYTYTSQIGLLPKDNHEQIPFAYKLYQRTDQAGLHLAAGFKQTFAQNVSVEFMGVW